MLVTFHTNAWSSITMFGDVATSLLKMAGHSATVPSAIRAADVPATLARLNQGLAAAIPDEERERRLQSGAKNDDVEPAVGIRKRAYPLIQLLSAAATQGCDVMWEQGAPPV
jgi:Domain of unknown function (DUF1840)